MLVYLGFFGNLLIFGRLDAIVLLGRNRAPFTGYDWVWSGFSVLNSVRLFLLLAALDVVSSASFGAAPLAAIFAQILLVSIWKTVSHVLPRRNWGWEDVALFGYADTGFVVGMVSRQLGLSVVGFNYVASNWISLPDSTFPLFPSP